MSQRMITNMETNVNISVSNNLSSPLSFWTCMNFIVVPHLSARCVWSAVLLCSVLSAYMVNVLASGLAWHGRQQFVEPLLALPEHVPVSAFPPGQWGIRNACREASPAFRRGCARNSALLSSVGPEAEAAVTVMYVEVSSGSAAEALVTVLRGQPGQEMRADRPSQVLLEVLGFAWEPALLLLMTQQPAPPTPLFSSTQKKFPVYVLNLQARLFTLLPLSQGKAEKKKWDGSGSPWVLFSLGFQPCCSPNCGQESPAASSAGPDCFQSYGFQAPKVNRTH